MDGELRNLVPGTISFPPAVIHGRGFLRRSKPSMLQGPAPYAVKNRKMKQSSTAGSPPNQSNSFMPPAWRDSSPAITCSRVKVICLSKSFFMDVVPWRKAGLRPRKSVPLSEESVRDQGGGGQWISYFCVLWAVTCKKRQGGGTCQTDLLR